VLQPASTPRVAKYMNMPLLIAFAVAVVLLVVGAALTPIGPWYGALRKPPWNPPNWLFGPAWTVLLGLWAWAGYLSWEGASDTRGRVAALILFGVNAVLYLMWSPLFFRLRRPDLALYEITLLLGSIVAMLIALPRYSVTASWLLVPYAAWVGFALCLNWTIVGLNREPTNLSV
jgi:benzodiazapine receptor